MLDIKITKTNNPQPKPSDEGLGFGKYHTDHMFLMEYAKGQGWINPRIEPYHSFEMQPNCTVLHYAQEIYEGLKAYRDENDVIRLFRPDCNAKRFRDSAERMCIPPIPEEDFIQAVMTLVDLDRDWVPHAKNTSLYMRPFIIATENALGFHVSSSYLFCIFASPSGAYFGENLKPVRIYVEDEYIRAAPGLTGAAKCGGNYAASLKATELAAEKGFDQVLWLDGVEKKYVEEVGAMNIFFKISGKIYTAPIVGTVLPGVTRRSCIELMRDWGYEVIEGKLAIDTIMEAGKAGELEEVFGSGTAAVVTPVGELCWKDTIVKAGDGTTGELTNRLFETMTGIQWGRIEDTKGWTVLV